MSGHTKGPWRLSFDPETGAFAIEDDNRSAILCSRPPWGHRSDESIANARLMAAAPDLMEACLEVHKCGNGGAKLSRAASDKVRAAIAKADPTP